MIVWLTPSRIAGFANGSWTRRRSWCDVEPNERPTSSDVSGTWRTPRPVRRIAGGMAKTTVAISAVGTPMPNSRTTGTR